MEAELDVYGQASAVKSSVEGELLCTELNGEAYLQQVKAKLWMVTPWKRQVV